MRLISSPYSTWCSTSGLRKTYTQIRSCPSTSRTTEKSLCSKSLKGSQTETRPRLIAAFARKSSSRRRENGTIKKTRKAPSTAPSATRSITSAGALRRRQRCTLTTSASTCHSGWIPPRLRATTASRKKSSPQTLTPQKKVARLRLSHSLLCSASGETIAATLSSRCPIPLFS